MTITQLIEKFEHRIFSCYEIGKWKPDPEIFLHAANVMGVDPTECAVIEDSLTGVQAAKKGGSDVYAFTNHKKKVAFENVGAKVFSEIAFLMDRLNGKR